MLSCLSSIKRLRISIRPLYIFKIDLCGRKMSVIFYCRDFTALKVGEINSRENGYHLFIKGNRNSVIFYRNIRLMLLLMKSVGLFPVVLRRTCSETTRISKLFFVYSLTVYLFILYNIAIIYGHSIPRMVDPNIAFNSLIYIIVNLTIIHLFTLVPYTHWLYLKSYVSHVTSWRHFMDHYETTFGSCPDVNAKKCVFIGISTIFIMILTLGGVLAYCLPNKLYVSFEMCGIIIILTSSGTLWCQFCKNARILGNDLCNRFKNIEKCSSSTKIHDILQTWLKLSTITQEIGDVFTKLIIVSIFLTIMSGVLAAFGQIIKILKGYPPNNDTLMSSFFAICDTFNLYTVGRKMLKTILSRNYSNSSLQELQQVDMFLQTLKINNPTIYLAGFIKINRKLLGKIYSTLTTYMIVLTQFQLTMPYQF